MFSNFFPANRAVYETMSKKYGGAREAAGGSMAERYKRRLVRLHARKHTPAPVHPPTHARTHARTGKHAHRNT